MPDLILSGSDKGKPKLTIKIYPKVTNADTFSVEFAKLYWQEYKKNQHDEDAGAFPLEAFTPEFSARFYAIIQTACTEALGIAVEALTDEQQQAHVDVLNSIIQAMCDNSYDHAILSTITPTSDLSARNFREIRNFQQQLKDMYNSLRVQTLRPRNLTMSVPSKRLRS